MAKKNYENKDKRGVTKYAKRFLWRKLNVNGMPLPVCDAHEVEACRRAMGGAPAEAKSV